MVVIVGRNYYYVGREKVLIKRTWRRTSQCLGKSKKLLQGQRGVEKNAGQLCLLTPFLMSHKLGKDQS